LGNGFFLSRRWPIALELASLCDEPSGYIVKLVSFVKLWFNILGRAKKGGFDEDTFTFIVVMAV